MTAQTGPNSKDSFAASASGRSVSPADWCCLPIWSAISSTTRSAIFRWSALAVGIHYHILFWQFLPVAMVFYTAALVHGGLGIWALYQRRQFRWKAVEPLQLLLGLSIPALVISHLAGVRLARTLFGSDKLYPQVFYADWVVAPAKMWMLFAVLIIAWIHGCIGLYFWLRMKAFFKHAAPFLLAAAVLVPTLALLGLYQGGRSVIREAPAPTGRWKIFRSAMSGRRRNRTCWQASWIIS